MREGRPCGDVGTRIVRALPRHLALAVALLGPIAGSAQALPTDEAVREILHQRIAVAGRGVACVVALVDETGVRVVSYGHATSGQARPGEVFVPRERVVFVQRL